MVSEDLRNEICVTSIEEGVHSVDVSKDKNTGVGVCLAQLKNKEKVTGIGVKWERGRKGRNNEVMKVLWALTRPGPIGFY